MWRSHYATKRRRAGTVSMANNPMSRAGTLHRRKDNLRRRNRLLLLLPLLLLEQLQELVLELAQQT